MAVLAKLLAGFGLFFIHPFYVSVTTVDYNESGKRLEISCRIFFDDLETAIRPPDYPDLDIVHAKGADKIRVDTLISDYLQQHLRMETNGKRVTLEYLGYRIEEDGAWCFLQARQVEKPQKLTVFNSLLFDRFENQSNIIHLMIGNQRKSTKLDNPKNLASFTF